MCNGLEELEGMVGWRMSSWGYHGDDGYIFHGGKAYNFGFDTYRVGDTVGCGLDKNNDLFFTKNGKKLPQSKFRRFLGQLFPCVRMAVGGGLKAEFDHTRCLYQLKPEDTSTMEDLRMAVELGWEDYRFRMDEEQRKRDQDETSHEGADHSSSDQDGNDEGEEEQGGEEEEDEEIQATASDSSRVSICFAIVYGEILT